MTHIQRFLRKHAKQIVALMLTGVLYGMTRLPELGEEERAEMAGRFRFVASPLPELPGRSHRTVRLVHPSLKKISAWISAVGAAVALNDLDGDGLPNDVCYVDPRTDQVIVAPVPGTPPRFAPFELDASPLPYDSQTMAPMGCLPADLDEDGRVDLLAYYWGRTPISFLRKETIGDGGTLSRDAYVAVEIVPEGGRWYTNAVTVADLDGDAHFDLVIGNYFQDDARILDVHATGSAQMQHSMTRAYNGGCNRLLIWASATTAGQPGVRFKEAVGVLESEVACGWTLAVGAADLDGDMLPEIYFSQDFGPDRLLHNRSRPGHLQFAVLEGENGLTTPSSKVLGRDSFKGMGVDFGDTNGDGLLDIYVSNIATDFALHESHFVFVSTGAMDQMWKGIAPYVDQSEPLGLSRSGWGWESRLADFDNSGVLEAVQATGFVRGSVDRWPELQELAMGNDDLLRHPRSWPRFQPGDDLSGHQRNPFFVRSRSGRYYDLARDIDGLGSPQVSRGIATADVDGSGRISFAVANQWEPSRFYRNESANPGAFLGLRLLLPVGSAPAEPSVVYAGRPPAELQGRSAIGAVAMVHLPNGRRSVGQVDGGNGHSGKRSPEIHFGLGDLPDPGRLRVDLRWRDAVGQIRSQTLHLMPGWHTVLLGNGTGEEGKQ